MPEKTSPETIIKAEDLLVSFSDGKGGAVNVLSDVSFEIYKGETVGFVGESGSGKSTTAKAIMQLPRPVYGSITYQDSNLTKMTQEELRKVRTEITMIFQDPISSLNPRRKVREIIQEGLKIWKKEINPEKIDEIMFKVGLNPETTSNLKPHELSGGQAQRVCIARALAISPKVLICDEPTSALDVSIQAQILNLLEDLKKEYNLTIIFISHDLAVIKNISDRIFVMYLGKIVEYANSDDLYLHPRHPYTFTLLSSMPGVENPTDNPPSDVGAEAPSIFDPPQGCGFSTRCNRATQECFEQAPSLTEVHPGHFVACYNPEPEIDPFWMKDPQKGNKEDNKEENRKTTSEHA